MPLDDELMAALTGAPGGKSSLDPELAAALGGGQPEAEPGPFSSPMRAFETVTAPLGYAKRGVDALARAGARAQGIAVTDEDTTGTLLREAAGFRPTASDSIGERLGGKAIEFATDIATDPLTYVLGGAGKISKAGKAAEAFIGPATSAAKLAEIDRAIKAGQTAEKIGRGAAAAFVPGMLSGAYHEGSSAIDKYRQQGLTPEVAELALGTALSGGMGLMSAGHATGVHPIESLFGSKPDAVPQRDFNAQAEAAPERSGLRRPAILDEGMPAEDAPAGPELGYGRGGIPVHGPDVVLPEGQALEESIQRALQAPPGPPRIAETMTPEALGMRPYEDVVNESVSRRMRQQGAADQQALDTLTVPSIEDRFAETEGPTDPSILQKLAEAGPPGTPEEALAQSAVDSIGTIPAPRLGTKPAPVPGLGQDFTLSSQATQAMEPQGVLDAKPQAEAPISATRQVPDQTAINENVRRRMRAGQTVEDVQREALDVGAQVPAEGIGPSGRRWKADEVEIGLPEIRKQLADPANRPRANAVRVNGEFMGMDIMNSVKPSLGLEGIDAEPREIVKAIDEDRNNPLYQDVVRAVTGQVDEQKFAQEERVRRGVQSKDVPPAGEPIPGPVRAPQAVVGAAGPDVPRAEPGTPLPELGADRPAPTPPSTAESRAIEPRAASPAAAHGGRPADAAPAEPLEPTYAYRARNSGQQGIPSDQNEHAHATMSESQAWHLAPSRTEAAQEMVRVDLSKMSPADYELKRHPDGMDWVKFKRPIAENEVDKVQPVTEVDRTASEKAAPAVVQDVQSRPVEELAMRAGLSDEAAAKGVADVMADGQREIRSPEATAVKRAALQAMMEEHAVGGEPTTHFEAVINEIEQAERTGVQLEHTDVVARSEDGKVIDRFPGEDLHLSDEAKQVGVQPLAVDAATGGNRAPGIEGPEVAGQAGASPAEPAGERPPVQLGADPQPASVPKFATKPAAPTFFSQLQKTIDEKRTPEVARGGDYYRFLTDPKRGVKAEEIKWTGLDDYLRERADKRVTKQEITDFLKQNNVEVQEVTKGAPEGGKSRDEWARSEYNKPYVDLDIPQRRWVNSMMSDEGYKKADKTKFSQYQLPGGENYRELLLTLPEKGLDPRRAVFEKYQPQIDAAYKALDAARGLDARDAAQTDVERLQALRDSEADALKVVPPTKFQSGHFDESNILAHVRFNERTDAAGKRVLFIEEVQSDWAQKGRKQGFYSSQPDLSKWRVSKLGMEDGHMAYSVFDEHGQHLDDLFGDSVEDVRSRLPQLQARRESFGLKGTGVPAAPFVEDTNAWSSLAMKRMVRWAAENGFDKVAWTKGETQAERYDLSKHIQKIEYFPESVGVGAKSPGVVRAWDHNGRNVLDKNATPEELPDIMGKEAADKILASAPIRISGAGRPVHMIEGLDLKVGGDGMAGFYDKILPSVAGKIGKKFGAKVGEAEIGTAKDFPHGHPIEVIPDPSANGRYTIKLETPEGDSETWGSYLDEGSAQREMAKMRRGEALRTESVHAMDITPEMRRSVVEEGQPLFKTATGEAPSAQPLTIDNIKRAFVGRDVEALDDGAHAVKLANGKTIRVQTDGSIELDPKAFEAGYARAATEGERAVGSFQRVGPDAIIRLAKEGADQGTLDHEAFHAAMDMVLTPKEKALILDRYKTEEAAADAYSKWDPGTPSNSLFARIHAFFQRIYRAWKPNAESVFGKVKSGEAFGREAVEGEASPRYAADVPKGASEPFKTLADLRAHFEGRGVENFVGEHGDVLTLSRVVIPKGQRGQGMGTEFMKALTDYADQNGKTLALSPSTDFGGSSVGRLREFYQRFGFVSNKGRSKDFTVSESMIREPKPGGEKRAPVPKYATAPATPPDVSGLMKKEERPGPKLVERREPESLGSPMKPGEAPRVETKVEALKGVAPNAKLARDAPRSWQSLDPEIKGMLADLTSGTTKEQDALTAGKLTRADLETSIAKREAAFWERIGSGRVNDVDMQVSDALVRGKAEAADALREKYIKASANGDAPQESLAYIKAALDAVVGDYARALKSDVQAGSKIGRAMAARARIMNAQISASHPDAFLRKIFREMPELSEKDTYALVEILKTDPSKLQDALHVALEPKLSGKLLEFWKAGLVSAPGTQVANLLGNMGEQVMRVGETAMAALIDPLFGGKRSRLTGEARYELAGSLKGTVRGIGDLGRSLKDIVTLAPEKIDLSRPLEYQTGQIGGKVGRAVRTPFRLLSAFDDYFKTIAGDAELHKRAYRRAGGDAAKAEAIMKDPPADLLAEIAKAKQERTFQNPNEIAQAIINLRSKNKLFQVIMPFVNTPANIARLTWERSPGGFPKAFKAWGEWKSAMKSGADAAKVAELRGAAIDALARPLVGTTLMLGFGALAKSGGMTGQGPIDPKDKNALKDSGWQPYSFVYTGNDGKKTYIPFSRFEPVSGLLGFAADMVEAKDAKTANDMFAAGIGSAVNGLLSKSFLTALADAGGLIKDPMGAGATYATNLAGSVIPNVVSKVAQAVDPTVRETKPTTGGFSALPERIGNTLRSRIPGLSKDLPARHGSLGEEVERPGSAASRFLLPVQASTDKPSAEMTRKLVDLDAVPTPPTKTISVKGKKVPLLDDEFAKLAAADQRATAQVQRLMDSGSFKRQPEEMQRQIVRSTFERLRGAARTQIIGSSNFRRRAREASRSI